MKLQMLKTVLIGAFCALLSMPVLAQEDELKKLDGYIDFGDLSATYGEPSISINIGGTLLQFVGAMSESSDPEAAKIMSELKGVRVFGYPIERDPAVARDKFTEVKSTLKKKGWEPVVQINEDDEQVLIYMKLNESVMEGMTVMTVDDEEVMFINIIGKLDPRQIGKVMEGFDVHINGKVDVD
ncbi:MAG: DUF4252 domain-containing protein [Xanthomonadales bacterium]|nr:DUF4252 domain-containing protein [Xanthomonadales bacterium]